MEFRWLYWCHCVSALDVFEWFVRITGSVVRIRIHSFRISANSGRMCASMVGAKISDVLVL